MLPKEVVILSELLRRSTWESGGWCLSSSSDPDALAVVDGLGRFSKHGPHYSRRSPGSKTFTGVGKEVVLLHDSKAAVWAVVYQKTPAKRGTGQSRGRKTRDDKATQWIWRNMLFRKLPPCHLLSSELIRSATRATYVVWQEKYGELPEVQLRTEIEVSSVKSSNPGWCYLCAGYKHDRFVRGKRYLWAPPPRELDVC